VYEKLRGWLAMPPEALASAPSALPAG